MGHFAKSVEPVPINGNILVKIIGNSRRTSGGLYVPETAKTYPIQGKVVEVSEGYYDGMVFKNHVVAIGDVIIFDWQDGFYLMLDEEEFRILHETKVMAILKGVNYGD